MKHQATMEEWQHETGETRAPEVGHTYAAHGYRRRLKVVGIRRDEHHAPAVVFYVDKSDGQKKGRRP